MFGTVLVIFGGISNENEISVITGAMAINVLKEGGERVLPLYVAPDGKAYCHDSLSEIGTFKGKGYLGLPRAVVADGGVYILNKRGKLKKFIKADIALNCCHGGCQEGGAVAGICAAAKIPLASAGMAESSVFMDKYITKIALRGLGVKTAKFARVTSLAELQTAKLPPFPVIVKPVSLGSSIGIQTAKDEAELQEAVEVALAYDGAALVEEYLPDRREINCAAYFCGGEVITSECEEAVSGGEILSYEDKYEGGGKSVLPADIPAELSRKIKRVTKEVYSGLNMRGIVRFDFIISGGGLYLSEVNTVPGSLSYYLLSSGFKDFYRVLRSVLLQAQKDFEASEKKLILSTGILENLQDGGIKLNK